MAAPLPDRLAAIAQQQATPLVVEDLVSGLNEWRNIQDVVRVTFKAFHDVLRAQGEAIKALEHTVSTKVSQTELQMAVESRAEATHTQVKLQELEARLQHKADAAELARRPAQAEVEALLAGALSEFRGGLSDAATTDALRISREQMDAQCASLAGDAAGLRGQVETLRNELQQCATVAEVTDALRTKADARALEERVAGLVSARTLNEALAQKATRPELGALEASLRRDLADTAGRLGEKADACALDEMRSAVAQHSSRADADADAAAAAMRGLSTAFDASIAELRAEAQANARKTDAHAASLHEAERVANERHAALGEALARKADVAEVHRLLEPKADIALVNEALDHKASTASVVALTERVNYNSHLSDRVAGMREEVTSITEAKANTADVCALLDVKANIEDVNAALLEVSNELDGKASEEEIRRVVRDQAIINSSLCADMSLARWIWKSNKTKAGGAVPWNVQTLNTDPDNFVWDKDKATVMTVAPGLYEVTFGFFSKRKPQVQLLINGDPVLSAINSTGYVTHHSSGRLTAVGNHPAGNVTGLTAIDFLALPPKARVTLTYQSDDKGEGFLSLKKL